MFLWIIIRIEISCLGKREKVLERCQLSWDEKDEVSNKENLGKDQNEVK